MPFEYQLLAAVILDFMLGDPQWFPHPVRLMGRFAIWIEPFARRLPCSLRMSGTLTALTVIGVTGGVAFGAIHLAAFIHPLAGDVVSISCMYTAIAARDLGKHSLRVYRALAGGNLVEAQQAVSRIVGRDTTMLDTQGVTRAAVESVAESIVDGITAPLFFACLFGPVGAMVYKAINTLDSTFGYKDERYLHFGWASARIDDVTNFIPARLTAPVMAFAGTLLGYSPLRTMRIVLRDHGKHESPNAAFGEAAMAGALGVQLGGLNYYEGEPLTKLAIGDALVELQPRHILAANRIMYVTTSAFALCCAALRMEI